MAGRGGLFRRTSVRTRPLVTALLVLQFIHTDTQPLPVLQLNRFGTKNVYNNTCCRPKDLSAANSDEMQFCCPPVQVVMLARHGIRYPGRRDILNGHSMLSEMKSHGISPTVYDRLKFVVDSFPLSEAALLAANGSKEQWNLGHRTGQRFASTFRKHDALTFVSSSTPRAVSSQECFQRGFDAGLDWKAASSYQQRNDLLRFFDDCPRYITDVKKNKSAFAEYEKFRARTFPEIVRRIAGRLGLDSLNISQDGVSSVYNLAAVEHAVLGTTHWANLLDLNDLIAMEFASDLKQYYKLSYGHPINYEISCPLISDLFHHMDDVVSGGYRSSRGVFYFGHAETFVPVLSALGFFRAAAPLRADLFDNRTQAEAREFRTSAFVPFSSNLAFVLYDCATSHSRDPGKPPGKSRKHNGNGLFDGGGDFVANVSSSDRYFVQFLLNERPVNLPFCDRSLCSYAQLRKRYSAFIDRCRFHQLCELPSEP